MLEKSIKYEHISKECHAQKLSRQNSVDTTVISVSLSNLYKYDDLISSQALNLH